MSPIKLAGLAVFFVAFLSAPVYPSAGVATQQVRSTVEKIQGILRDSRARSDAQKKSRRAQLSQAIARRFDFADMAQRALGQHWQARAAGERAYFVKVFSGLLEDAYLDQIEPYAGDRFVYLRESRDGEFAEVDTKALGIQGDELSVGYRLRARGGEWKVYDLVIENVSVVNNYRSQFNRVLSGAPFSDLLKKLRDTRNRQLQAKKTRPDSTVLAYWALAQAAPNRPR